MFNYRKTLTNTFESQIIFSCFNFVEIFLYFCDARKLCLSIYFNTCPFIFWLLLKYYVKHLKSHLEAILSDKLIYVHYYASIEENIKYTL